MSSQQQSLCVLFADVSGSTRLYEKLGDAEALRAVERCLNRIRRVVDGHGGRVIKTIGDEVMTTFRNADAGIQAACEMQHRVTDLPPVSGVKLAIRVGFHYGPTIEENDDVFGDTVNTAARMAGLAKAAQIITTAETLASLTLSMAPEIREIDALTVKGKAEDVRVCEVLWQDGADLTMKASSVMPLYVVARLAIRYRDTEVTLDPAHGPLTLGRDMSNEVVIKDQRASRNHARIERRRDKFVLVDQSTNGTFLRIEGENEVILKREEMILRGQGTIGFGHSALEQGIDLLHFDVLE
ncbi:MAG: adenylate/guanylate cyclase domain-containing protein [Gammaproteobacteria bacterium]|jgi:adenylate cyclase|nr:adenylate/guanylate cyclase domain-containing protein [Gammaproteobacteria bacterium]MBU0770309.1 adenylate/guanylate cyclase domain-containing protein [Gammaproteobacteria bacterium]MBU0857251.1 adenylate/guanylate cyclase domain-containing protein [Gammaproteobacteria bacterium]MBU1847926.1 adenylate/guanylate cyclase domain-containing protein [Gammaproteobacteria bacterium]